MIRRIVYGEVENQNGYLNFKLLKCFSARGERFEDALLGDVGLKMGYVLFRQPSDKLEGAQNLTEEERSLLCRRTGFTLYHSIYDEQSRARIRQRNITKAIIKLELDGNHSDLKVNSSRKGIVTSFDWSSCLVGDINDLSPKVIRIDQEADLANPALIQSLNFWERGYDDFGKQYYRVYKEFRDFLVGANDQDLIALRETLRYNEGHVPGDTDYSDQHFQQLYLLKYAYAYIYKYYKMYQDIYSFMDLKNDTVRILSIGCGAKLDGDGAKLALNTCLIENKPELKYLGIDYAAWNAHGYESRICENDFVQSDIFAFLNVNNRLDYNIIMFPTSISEFYNRNIEEDKLTRLCQSLFPKLSSSKVVIGVTLRDDEGSRENDERACDCVIQQMARAGYRHVAMKYSDYEYEMVHDDASFYRFPNDFSGLLSAINENAYGYREYTIDNPIFDTLTHFRTIGIRAGETRGTRHLPYKIHCFERL